MKKDSKYWNDLYFEIKNDITKHCNMAYEMMNIKYTENEIVKFTQRTIKDLYTGRAWFSYDGDIIYGYFIEDLTPQGYTLSQVI